MLKNPISLDDQVVRLREHKMDIKDVALAKRVLSEVNYYRFTGYALQFRDESHPDDYIPGTAFETIWMLHQFDSALRASIKPFLDIVELYARSQIAYGFAMEKCMTPPHDQHYDSHNYYYKDRHRSIFTSNLTKEKEHSKDTLFVKHHSDKYGGKMPLWVIVELLSFTNLSKLFSAMYLSEQEIIASNMGTAVKTIKNHLHCLANLRNRVAHAVRLYNDSFNPPAILGRKYSQQNPDIESQSLFTMLLVLLRRLPNDEDKSLFIVAIKETISKYSEYIQLTRIGFPDDYNDRLSNEVK